MKKKHLVTIFAAASLLILGGCSNNNSKSNSAKSSVSQKKAPESATDLAKIVKAPTSGTVSARITINDGEDKDHSVSNDISFGKHKGQVVFDNDYMLSASNGDKDADVQYELYLSKKDAYLTSISVSNGDERKSDDGNYKTSSDKIKNIADFDKLRKAIFEENILAVPSEIAKKADFQKTTKTKKKKTQTLYKISYHGNSKKVNTAVAHKYIKIMKNLLPQQYEAALKKLESSKFETFMYSLEVNAKTNQVTYFDVIMSDSSDPDDSIDLTLSYYDSDTVKKYGIPSYVKEDAKTLTDKDIKDISGQN